LGVDTDENEDTKGRYKFPYSDFAKVHRYGVLAAENRAGQYKYIMILNRQPRICMASLMQQQEKTSNTMSVSYNVEK
jgi:hypothetical protein